MLGPDERRRREIDEEIDAHLQARVDYLVARGMSQHDARAEALRRFGNLQTGRARLFAQAAGDDRRRRLRDRAEALWQDVRYVCRSLARQPAFTFGVIATLALGLGINAAVFRVADRVLLRPPDGVVRAGELRYVETAATGGNVDTTVTRLATFGYLESRQAIASDAFAAASLSTMPRILAGQGGKELSTIYADASYFPLLGVTPAAGRFFDTAEGEPGAEMPVAVVSHDYWQHDLAGAPISSAPSLAIGTRTFQVIGVAPPGFIGIDLDPVQVWLPLGVAELGRGYQNGVFIPWYRADMMRAMRIVGRLAPGDRDGAVASAKIAAAMAASDRTGSRQPRTSQLQPIVPVGGATIGESSQRMLTRLSLVAVIVLLIACANAMHLLLARGTRRQREIATRIALGAGRARVWRLLMVESVILALAGGVVAAIAGGWCATALRTLVFPDGRWTTPIVDARSLAVTVVLAIVAGLVAGIAPAMQATAPDLVSAIKSGRIGAPRRARLTRGALLVTQTALSIVLLVAAGLLVRSLVRLQAFNLGFDVRDLVTVSLVAPFPATPDQTAPQVDALIERLRATEPGVQIATSSPAPFGAMKSISIIIPGSKFEPPNREGPRVMDVSPEYFSVMRTRVTWGRGFNEGDVAGEPVAIVNATMARNYWGATLPPGACVLPYGSPCRRVIGIVEDLNDAPGVAAAPMRFYLPADRASDTLVMRARAGDAPALAARVKAALPATQRVTIAVVSERIGRVVRPWRMATTLFVALGVVALVLACVGIYSIMSYAASERVQELGVRVALGATASDVLMLVIGGGLRLAIAGGVAGLAAAAAGGHLLSSLLYDVSPFDPAIYALAFVFMTMAGLGSMLPAALRASRVDAVVALRTE